MIDEDELEVILHRVLNERRKLDDETHNTHHEFIKLQMLRWERRQQLWQKFKLSFIGAVAVALVSGLMWIGKAIIDHWPHK